MGMKTGNAQRVLLSSPEHLRLKEAGWQEGASRWIDSLNEYEILMIQETETPNQGIGQFVLNTMRVSESGAIRSPLGNKPQYEGYNSPLVEWRFGQFMLKHQTPEDGSHRDADNWQKGMDISIYIDSMHRHYMDLWLHHRGYSHLATEPLEEALCALRFNVNGYLFETLKAKK